MPVGPPLESLHDDWQTAGMMHDNIWPGRYLLEHAGLFGMNSIPPERMLAAQHLAQHCVDGRFAGSRHSRLYLQITAA